MLAYTYVGKGDFRLQEKPVPVLQHEQDAIVKVTLASICTSDLHIKYGSVPQAVPGITVGHEMVGVVSDVGPGVSKLHPGDRVAVNVETFCGSCFFAGMDGSIIVRIQTAAGAWGAASTGDRLSMFACPMPTRA